MAETVHDQFAPDYAVPPGEILLETLESIGMTQADLAKRTGRPLKTINEIVKGKASITPETALQLERVLGVPASFWNGLERNYQETIVRLRDQVELQRHIAWAEQFPVREMTRLGWLPVCETAIQRVEVLLRFFGVATPDQWDEVWKGSPVYFRRSAAYPSDPAATAAWLRKGEIEAQQMDCKPYDSDRLRAALQAARALTVKPPEEFCDELRRLFSEAGIAVAYVRDLPKTRASGATRWLTSEKAMIQMGLRYKTNDHWWFTLFHEAGHIVLHGKRDVFVENHGDRNTEKENEANRFAAELLIPSEDLVRLIQAGPPYSKADIRRFAEEIGVEAGIVVGRMQHDGHLPVTHCNDLKQRFVWV